MILKIKPLFKITSKNGGGWLVDEKCDLTLIDPKNSTRICVCLFYKKI